MGGYTSVGGGTDVPDRGVFPTGVGGVGHGTEPSPLPGRLPRRDMDGGASSKMRKAIELAEAGHRVEIIGEDDFLRLLNS